MRRPVGSWVSSFLDSERCHAKGGRTAHSSERAPAGGRLYCPAVRGPIPGESLRHLRPLLHALVVLHSPIPHGGRHPEEYLGPLEAEGIAAWVPSEGGELAADRRTSSPGRPPTEAGRPAPSPLRHLQGPKHDLGQHRTEVTPPSRGNVPAHACGGGDTGRMRWVRAPGVGGAFRHARLPPGGAGPKQRRALRGACGRRGAQCGPRPGRLREGCLRGLQARRRSSGSPESVIPGACAPGGAARGMPRHAMRLLASSLHETGADSDIVQAGRAFRPRLWHRGTTSGGLCARA